MGRKIFVTLFGRFTIRQEEKGRCQGQKKFSSKESVCLAYLLLNHAHAVSKEELIDVLWGEKESRNPINALKTLIHRLRQHLNDNFGEDTYILELGGKYQWNEEIEVEVDVECFDLFVRKAEKVTEEEEKIYNYERAMQLYKGSILPERSDYPWFVVVNSGYRTLFTRAACQLNELYLKNEEYEKMEDLCLQKILCDEANEDLFYYLILAKIELEKFDEALKVYYKAEKILSNELGITNFEKLQTLWDKIVYSEQTNQIQDLKMLNLDLHEINGTGAFFCSYHAFKEFYRMEKRKIQRDKMSGEEDASQQRLLLLFSVEYKESAQENAKRSMAIHEREMNLVQFTLIKNLRAVDIVTRSNHFQFVALLKGCSENEFKIIENRIRRDIARKNKDIILNIEFGDFDRIK